MTGRWGAAGRSKTEECVDVGRPLVELFAPGLIRPPYVNVSPKAAGCAHILATGDLGLGGGQQRCQSFSLA